MADFLYVPPYRQWSLFGTVTVSGSPGVLDSKHEASWLVDGREKYPLRLTTPDGSFEVENPAAAVGFVGLFHHLLDGDVEVALSGDVSGEIVVPAWPRNGVPYNAVTLIEPEVAGVTSIIATIAGSPANTSDVLIGEFIAGAPLVLEGLAKFLGIELPKAAEKGVDGINAALTSIEDPVIQPRIQFPGDLSLPSGTVFVPPEGAARGAKVTATGLEYFAGGRLARGTDTIAAMVSPDELIINAAQQRNIAEAISGGGRPMLVVERLEVTGVFSEGDLKQTMVRSVIPALESVWDDNVNGARTRTQDILQITP